MVSEGYPVVTLRVRSRPKGLTSVSVVGMTGRRVTPPVLCLPPKGTVSARVSQAGDATSRVLRGEATTVDGLLSLRSVGVTPPIVHVMADKTLVCEHAIVVVVLSPTVRGVSKSAA